MLHGSKVDLDEICGDFVVFLFDTMDRVCEVFVKFEKQVDEATKTAELQKIWLAKFGSIVCAALPFVLFIA